MKKIIMSLAMIAAAGALVVGATGAYFSDTEESTGNTFSAGTLDLSIPEAGNPQEFPVSFTNMMPGEWTGKKSLELKNTGSLQQVVDRIQVNEVAEKDTKAISGCFKTNEPSVTTKCDNIHGNVEMDIDYDSTNATYSLLVPGLDIDDGDNFDLAFDGNNDGEADFQVKYQKGALNNHAGNWHYAPVVDGSWDKWNDLPADITASRSGDEFTVQIALAKLGGADSEYRFGFQGRWNGDYPGYPGNNAVFEYPTYFSWGENSVGSEDYQVLNTGEVDKNANSVAKKVNVKVYQGGLIREGTLWNFYKAGNNRNMIQDGDETTLNPGDSGEYKFQFQLDENAGNDFQGDGIEATFEVEAVQPGQE